MNATASIFIVEDEAIIAMELQDQLRTLGYHVCGHAARGETALERIRELQPDLILMDIHLAGSLTGIDTAEQLGHGAAVIFLSAYSDPALLNRAVSSGAFGYLVKPLNPRALHAAVQVALHRHQAEGRLRRFHDDYERRVAKFHADLQQATDQLTICPHCRTVHVAKDGWDALERFIGSKAPTPLGYSPCQACLTSPASHSPAASSPG